MTFNYIAAQKSNHCKKYLDEKLSRVMDIGAQTPSIRNSLIKDYIQPEAFYSNKQELCYRKIINEEKFSTKDFFLALGYKNYFSIDINGANESFQFDLNQNISQAYNFNERYELVINNGTGEHVFNQYSLYENIHNLTNKNGIMLHIMPFINWVNHGFYNFNPILYADLAAANNYHILDISLANNNGAEIKFTEQENSKIMFEQVKPKYTSYFKNFLSEAKSKLSENIMIVIILKKTINEDFKIPLQGKYLEDIPHSNTGYKKQGTGSSSAFGQEKDGIKRNK